LNGKLNEAFAKAFFYTKLGWGNYISWWLSAIAYVTIIYELALKFVIPAGPIVYALIFLGIMALSSALGYFMAWRAKVYGVEHKINTETNPYIHIPVGDKEILNYQNQIMQFDVQIESLKKQIEMCNALGIDAKELEAYLPKLEEYKKRYVEMLNRAKT